MVSLGDILLDIAHAIFYVFFSSVLLTIALCTVIYLSFEASDFFFHTELTVKSQEQAIRDGLIPVWCFITSITLFSLRVIYSFVEFCKLKDDENESN